MEYKTRKFLSVKEVASMLEIAEKTVRKYVWLKSIPYSKINGHVRFDQARIDAWLLEREVPTIDEILNQPSKRRGGRIS